MPKTISLFVLLTQLNKVNFFAVGLECINFAKNMYMEDNVNNKPYKRIIWLDWMKVWAILSIIWGHFFSAGHVYLYVFSVQVFCVISGFLYKKHDNLKVCISKCFWQLFVPTVILSFIMQLEAYFRCIALGLNYNISWPWFFEWLLLGHRWCMGPCWYFYSLIVMRLVMQMLPERRYVYMLLFVVLSSCAIYLHFIGFEVSNANVNVVVCMPFFLIGVFLKPMRNTFCQLHNIFIEVCILIASFAVIFLCGYYNGYVWMYKNGFGNNYIMYLLGGMAGASMLYIISLWLNRLHYQNMVVTLSKGSILIIGLHITIVRRLTQLPDRYWVEDLILAILILLAFLPIVQLAERFCPILIGKRTN